MEKLDNKKNNRLRPFMRIVAGVVIGGILGFAYYWFIGCRTGSCRITGDPVISSLYGSFIGLIWVFPFGRKKEK
jgi:hypothetical protein